MVTSVDAVRRFVLDYFHLIGAALEPCGHDVFRVELDEHQAAAMEGRMVNPWNEKQGGKATYYFTFTSESADSAEDVECITVGSQRLHQIIQSVRGRGEVSQLWLPIGDVDVSSGRPSVTTLPPEASLAYRPFYIFLLTVQRRPSTRRGDVTRIAVDLVDGIPLRHMAHVAPDLHWRWGMPRDERVPVEPARIDLDEAFQIAFRELTGSVESSWPRAAEADEGALGGLIDDDDIVWAKNERRAVESEAYRLHAFYRQIQSEGYDTPDEKQKRMNELKRLEPRILVRPAGLAFAHVPVISSGSDVQYLTAGAKAMQ